jgi:hypothetical protein
MVAEPPPDPGQIGHADVRKHERRLRIALGQRQRVPAERGDPEPGVDRHRHSALTDDGTHRRDAGMTKVEPLRARMQLHPAGARSQAAFQLANRIGVRIDPAEGDEATVRVRRSREDRVVRLAVARPLHQRKHHRSSLDQCQRIGQLVRRARPPFRIVATQVRVGIEQPHPRQLHDKAAKPRQQQLIRVHPRPR